MGEGDRWVKGRRVYGEGLQEDRRKGFRRTRRKAYGATGGQEKGYRRSEEGLQGATV